MEFTEVVTPSVAVPVLCVLVCAFLVFAFGFKSPAQPPSFDVFDEDGKKKRLKKARGIKGQSNGHAVVEGDVNTSAKPQPSPRQAAKQPTKSQSPPATKTKPASQNQDQSKKTKKQALKEVEMKQKQKEEEKKIEEMQDDTDGWHTVIVSKKDKKQKKKETEKPELAIDEPEMKEIEGVQKPKPEESTEQASPMEQRNKKKKDKKAKKPKSEEEVKEVVEKQSAPVVVQQPVIQEAPSVVEIEIKDAMETTVDEVQVSKKKGKGNNKKEDKKDSPPPDDFVIPKSALEPEVEVRTLSPSNNKTDISDTTSKSPKKKKKDKSKRKDEKIDVDSPIPEDSQTGASGSLEASLTNTNVSSSIPPKSSSEVQSPVTQEPQVVVPASTGAEAAASVQSPTFDEMGGSTENWTEAKPKSKKKKARRAD